MAVNWNQSGVQTSVLETVALVIIIALIFWFFVRPQMGVLSQEQGLLQQAQTEYKQVDQDKQELTALIAKLKKSQTDLTLVDEALPLQGRPTQMEYLINDLVTAAGMTTTDLNLTVKETSGAVAGNKNLLKDPYAVNRKLQTTDLNLTVSGGVDQFKNLLQLLETNGRIIDVDTLDMSDQADNPVFQLKLKVYSYVP